MRIALVVIDFPKTSETFIVNQFLGLLDRGNDVYIVCNHARNEDWGHFPQLNTDEIRRRIRVDWSTSPRWRIPFLLPILLLSCLFLNRAGTLYYLRHGYQRFGILVFKHFYLDAPLIRLQPDIVHFEFGTLAVERMHLKPLLGSKITVSFRGHDINYAGLSDSDYYADVWQDADRLHFLGKDLHNRAISRGLSPDKPFSLIPPAIDTTFFVPNSPAHATQSDAKPLRILSVGRLEWKKGYEFGLQAVKILVEQYNKPVEYRIIGDGELFEALHFCRYQLGLEAQVTFLEAVPHIVVVEEMLKGDIFLHAAVSEGFCNAALEAQAMCLPVVTSDADGLSENVRDNVTGFVVPRRDAHALAEKLLQLALDADLRVRMGSAGRDRVREHFHIEQQIDAFERFFEQAAAAQ